MPKVLFKPSPKSAENYVLHPLTRQARQALGVIFSYKDLPAIAQAALQKGEYANTDYGHGLEYPTRADRADQVRIWRWEWRDRKGKAPEGRDQTHKIIYRKWHVPERVYLGVLVGVLECNGYMTQAAKIRDAKTIEPVNVQYKPNIYNLGQYTLEPFSKEAHSCLGLALYLKNLEQTRELAISRNSFEYLDDEAFMNFYAYIPDEFKQRRIRFEPHSIILEYFGSANGKFEPTQQILPLDLYLDMLEQLLFIHGLPSLRNDSSSIPTVLFEPSVHDAKNYQITATPLQYALLEIIVAWVRLEDWIKMVLDSKPYGLRIILENDSGVSMVGDEVTITLADHTQQRIEKTVFLSVLAAIVEARGDLENAQKIQALQPLETISVQFKPDVYNPKNYIITPFDARVWDCLTIMFCRQNFELAWAEAQEKRSFAIGYYHPTFSLIFRTDNTVELKMPNGNDRIMPENLYLSVLEQVKGIHDRF
ncbi:MAG: hypothetical protein RLZZ156_428 [Deinococcota bacterium]|jgi:hypothetical protein